MTQPRIAEPADEDRARSHRVTFLPDGRTVTAAPGDTVLDAALRAGIELEHACGGCCACSTCHVIIADGGASLEGPNEREEDMLELAPGLTSRSRLACCTVIDRDLVVEIPARNRNLVSEGRTP